MKEIENRIQKQKKTSQEMKDLFISSFTKFVVEQIVPPELNISLIPPSVRLAMVQITKKEFRGVLRVGGKEIPYMKGSKVKRMLSFVTNFTWGVEKIEDERLEETPFITKLGKKTVNYEASVKCTFWYEWNGERRTHTCRGAFQSFKNPAVSKFAVLQMAQTNATKTFSCDIFGIGADIKDEEAQALKSIRIKSFKNSWEGADFEEGEYLEDVSIEEFKKLTPKQNG